MIADCDLRTRRLIERETGQRLLDIYGWVQVVSRKMPQKKVIVIEG